MACSFSNRSFGEGRGKLRVPLSLRGGSGFEVSIWVSWGYEGEVFDLILGPEGCAEVVQGFNFGLGLVRPQTGLVDGRAGPFADGRGQTACFAEQVQVFVSLGEFCELLLDGLSRDWRQVGPREQTGLRIGLGVRRLVGLEVDCWLLQLALVDETLSEARVPLRARSKW